MTERTRADRAPQNMAWLLVSLVGGLLVGVAVGGGCVTDDPDYCDSDSFCLQSRGSGYMCNMTLKSCVPRMVNSCSNNDACTDPSLPYCDPASKHCVACTLDAAGDQACSRFADTPLCGTAPGSATRCVACRENSHCPESAPICQNQICRKCNQHADCEGTLKCHDGSLCQNSLVCIGEGELSPGTEGRCALNGDRGQVVYIRKQVGACKSSGTVGGNTPDDPFCTLDAGYTAALTQTNRTYVRVIGDNSPLAYYDAMSIPIDKGKFVFIGAPSPVLQVTRPATIHSRGTSFAISNASSNVTVDYFNMVEVLLTGNLLSCINGDSDIIASLTVRNNVMEGSVPVNETWLSTGIAADRCNLRVYNNYIGVPSFSDLQNPAATAFDAGIGLASSRSFCKRAAKAEIYNNVIAGNMWAGIDLSSFSCQLWTVDMRFNTVVGNGRRTSGGVIGGMYGPPKQFPQPAVTIGQSLFNNILTAGTQFVNADTVTWKDSVVQTSEMVTLPGLTKADFELEAGFLLKSSSTVNGSCCIDKAKPGTGDTFPTSDLAGNPRPKGSGYDIGAFEVR